MKADSLQHGVMEYLCSIIMSNDYIENCEINDFGDYGNYNLFIKPKLMERTSTNKIKGIVTSAIKKVKSEYPEESSNLHVRQYFSPEIEKEWCKYDKKYNNRGYNRNYWSYDIDFMNYIADSNAFI